MNLTRIINEVEHTRKQGRIRWTLALIVVAMLSFMAGRAFEYHQSYDLIKSGSQVEKIKQSMLVMPLKGIVQ